MKILFSIILIGSFTITLYGARPLSTDDAGIVEKNKCEIEVGFNSSKLMDNSTEQNIDYSIKYGISGRADVGFAFSEEMQDTLHFTPAEFSIKILFYQSKSFLPDIAFTFITTPGDFSYALNFIISKEIKRFIMVMSSFLV